jgi:hypothetical protein
VGALVQPSASPGRPPVPGPFKSYLVDPDEYLLALLRYIHENPVGAGMVERAQEYRWSSDRYFQAGLHA